MTVSSEKQYAVRLIKDTAQIVDIIGEHVDLKRAGVNLKGRCPFHAEKTPSFVVNPDRQSFHCFGCGEGGDVFSFMMKYHRLTFPEALKELAQRYNIELPDSDYSTADQAQAEKRQKLFSINSRAAESYHEFLLHEPAAAVARAYLRERGVPDEAVLKYKLGFAPDRWDFLCNRCTSAGLALEEVEAAGLVVKRDRGGYYDRFRSRLLFPIYDMTGKVVGFGGRIIGAGEPKYLNSPETLIYNKGRILFGLYHHRDAIRGIRRAVVVEGNFDLISLAIHGVDYCAAPLGTALTNSQIRVLKGYADEVILLFDGDAAGLKAAMRSVPIFLAEQVQARIVVLPAGHDPDTFIREHGKQALEERLDKAMPLPEFVLENLVQQYGLTMEGKGRILKELQPLVASTDNNPLQRSVLISRFADRLQLDVKQLADGFNTSSRPEARTVAVERPVKMNLPGKQKQLLEFLIIHPDFLPQFMESGIEEVLVEPTARTILGHLRTMNTAGGRSTAEMLLDVLPDGAERSFVTSLLISAPTYGEEEENSLSADMAAEQLAWLKKMKLKSEIEALSSQIQAAKRMKDDELLLALSSKKIAINKILNASPTGDEG
jgi:DNA primase